ncbi:MAG TPA: methylthioribulose 1-phosphate dehydratase [Turneriella sp.]|nr:methylthioribulose 1-phosphate dehydratase [Turneriella sp.]
MTEDNLKDHPLAHELAGCGNLFHRWQWSLASSSNYSALLDAEQIIISQSGVDKERMTSADFMLVDFDAKPLAGFEVLKPSAETALHCQIYQKADLFHAGSVLHTHSKFSVFFSRRHLAEGKIIFSGFEMQKIFDGIATHESEIEIAVFKNSQTMRDITKAFDDYLTTNKIPAAYLIEGHGVYTWAKTILHAKQKLEALEHLFELKYMEELCKRH